MAQRIVIARILEHPDEHGGLFDLEVMRFFAEIYVGCSLDADSVVEEVEPVEIHVDDLVLCIETFEFDGYHPFDRLLHGSLEQVGRGL